MSTYYKNNQFITKPFTANAFTISLDSIVPVNKIRISLALTNGTIPVGSPVVLIARSSLVNGIIGTLGSTCVGVTPGDDLVINDVLKPSDGIFFYYPNKFFIRGDYEVKLTYLNDLNLANIPANGSLFILVEYYN
jgi:hypothetical protein